ncbi:YheC/YheD family protein [Bacillus sp. 31A1R]|uniref:YheC/YheD family protein n=1 Tax=Robertmurraya mangrovi TaxID=3098077 RepID=A0ABU5IWA5_9BACI|nr:YheC/YheD family protein [Bacillus sp. 31A1R]MDZ5471411.1 YheC/YheD family protein [Bacillus sp. 31A1R]
MKDPKVGILIDSNMYRMLKTGKDFYEKFSFYEEAANEIDLDICYFRLEDVNFDSCTTSVLIRNKAGLLVTKEIKIPKVIHNRALFSTRLANGIINLSKMGYCIFNEMNKIGKWKVHSLLMKNQDLLPHLPETVSANQENLVRMLEKYEKIIIKPINGGLGRGIISISKKEDQTWIVHYNQQRGKPFEEIVFSNKLPKIITEKLNRGYIIQQRIPLATYKGNPFDLRVSVQKNGLAIWQVTGIVAKVASPGGYVTNVARGGECISFSKILEDYPHLDAKTILSRIERLSVKAMQVLSSHYSNLADVGLDIGITNEGFPMFIECNGRDLRYSFGAAGMHDVWKEAYATPIRYAQYLLNISETM